MVFGDFKPFCKAAPLPVCKVVLAGTTSCTLNVKSGKAGTRSQDPASLVIDCLAIVASIGMLWYIRQWKKPRQLEMRIFLAIYLVQSFLDCWTTSRPVLTPEIVQVFAALEVSTTAMMFWALLMYSLGGLPFLKSRSKTAIAAVSSTGLVVFAITCAIAMVTVNNPEVMDPDYEGRNPGLYVMYLGVPLICAVAFAAIETFVLVKLNGMQPFLLLAAIVCFVVGQVFEFAISVEICRGTGRNVDGAFFQTAFSLIAVILLYLQWGMVPPPESAQDSSQVQQMNVFASKPAQSQYARPAAPGGRSARFFMTPSGVAASQPDARGRETV